MKRQTESFPSLVYFFHLINKSTSCVLKKDNKLKVINSNLKAAFRYLSMNRYYGKDITSPSLFYNVKGNSVYNVPHNLKKNVYMCHETEQVAKLAFLLPLLRKHKTISVT